MSVAFWPVPPTVQLYSRPTAEALSLAQALAILRRSQRMSTTMVEESVAAWTTSKRFSPMPVT